ncbi:MAG TPA: hypothetical protein DDW27_13330 [Bacteroidales bacterium]|nr:hypothetical protein [Bacteroidales bacterium]
MEIKDSLKVWLFIVSFIILTSCGSFVNDIEGNRYRTVRIGDQEWIAENLNVSHFRNGDSIPEARDSKEWQTAGREGRPVWCYFDNDPANGGKFGKLYNWYAVNDSRGLAPEKWYIAGNDGWTQLIDYLGGEKVAAEKMKSGTGWQKKCNGTNESGFSSLPGGYRHYDGGFNRLDENGGGYWWSSEQGFIYITCSYPLYYSKGGGSRYFTSKARGFSVRCIKY